MSKPWTEEEINILKEYYPIEGKKIQERLPTKSPEAIISKASKLNLKINRKCDICIVGNKINHWTIINTNPINPGERFPKILCRCDCGTERWIYKHQLISKTGPKMCHRCSDISHRKYNKYDLSGEFGIGYTSNTNSPFYFDLDKYDLIKEYTWLENTNHYIRATRGIHNKHIQISLHQLIMESEGYNLDNFMVDHINHDVHDNRIANLRIANRYQNAMNKKILDTNVSGYPGVYETKAHTWGVRLRANGEYIYLGTYPTKEEAIKIKIAAEKKYFKEFRNKALDELSFNLPEINLPNISIKKQHKWTKEEINILMDNKDLTPTQLSKLLPNCSKHQIYLEKTKLGINIEPSPKWTQEEIDILKQWYPIEGLNCIKRLNRSIDSISKKASRLNLKCRKKKNNTDIKYIQVNLFDE